MKLNPGSKQKSAKHMVTQNGQNTVPRFLFLFTNFLTYTSLPVKRPAQRVDAKNTATKATHNQALQNTKT